MLVGWCGDPQNAADVLQEVFRRLAASPALMAKMNNTRAFLAVSARRIAVDFARRSATRTAYHTAAGGETPSSENPGPTDEALRLAIRRALESLPAEQRTIFEHKVLKGRTLEEISKLEDISLNTAASRLRYAIDKIRGQLRPYYDDLNRKDFKTMKNDPSKTEDVASERIITPLAPKRVPSVAPGLEGLAAMAPDACEAAPEVAVYESDYVEAAPAAELVEPEIAFCGIGGNAWEANVPETVELPTIDVEGTVSEGAEEAVGFVVSEEKPEMISCEILPDGGIPEEWLRPILVVESPEDFFVTVFEGETESSVDGVVDSEFVDGEVLPFCLEEGFEICVLPAPEEFSFPADPQEWLTRYNVFLDENPDWLVGLAENQGDWFYEPNSTVSGRVEGLVFETEGQASAFDQWFDIHFGEMANASSEEDLDYGGAQPDYGDDSWSFDPKDLVALYEDFLRENPDWGALDSDMMEIQVLTNSDIFGEFIQFPTPSKAAAFDNWYVNVYAHDASDGSINLGGSGDGEYGTIVSDDLHSRGKDLLETTGVITDTRNGLTGVPAEWMRGGAANTDGLMFNGGGVPTLGEASQTVVTGETLVSNEGGQVVSEGKVYAYNPEFGSGSLPDLEAQLGASELPTEIAITGDAVADAASPFGNVAAGLAPTPGEALIVEFGVLSPSEPLQAPQMQTGLHDSDDLPQSVVASSGGSTGTGGADAALSDALGDAMPDNALPHAAASAQESAPASDTGIKVDAPTAAAGAVAAGTVVHGGAASTPALRRSLPTL